MGNSESRVSPVAGVDGLQPYIPGKPIEEVERELGITGICKLASNENPYGPSAKALKACREGLHDLELYPDANSYYLRSALSEFYGLPTEQLVVGNGSNELITVAIRTLVAPGREVVVSRYAFFIYAMQAKILGAQVVTVDEKDWRVDVEAMADAITPATRLLCLANPNNPTGTWLSRNELTFLLDAVPENVAVYLDEAYFEYACEAEYPDGFKLLETYPNLIVSRTYSKMYGLAGLRVGYAAAHPELVDYINRVRDPFNVNLVAQRAAVAALRDTDHVRNGRDGNARELARLTEYSESRSLAYIPSAGNFLSVEFGQRSQDIYSGLLKRGIIVRPVANYGMPDHLRITAGRAEENSRLFEALDELL